MSRFFEWFQLGALAALVALLAGRTLYLRVARGIQPVRLLRGKPPAEALLEALLVAMLPLWAAETFAVAWPLPWTLSPAPLHFVVLHGLAFRVAGCLLATGGIAFFAAALSSFGDSWRVGIDRDSPGALVTQGIFAVTRNPIFLFMDAFVLGIFLLNGRVLFGLFALLAMIAIHLQIRREEAFLEQHYGAAYRAYCERAPRYLRWRTRLAQR